MFFEKYLNNERVTPMKYVKQVEVTLTKISIEIKYP